MAGNSVGLSAEMRDFAMDEKLAVLRAEQRAAPLEVYLVAQMDGQMAKWMVDSKARLMDN